MFSNALLRKVSFQRHLVEKIKFSKLFRRLWMFEKKTSEQFSKVSVKRIGRSITGCHKPFYLEALSF